MQPEAILLMRDLMVYTTQHLMQCGFRVIYGYTQSDEISMLFHRDEETFERKTRKFNSILAAEASGAFSLRLGALGTFDSRISQLPLRDQVIDYFRWRSEDAHRNALNGHCYWLLRKQGQSVGKATSALEGMSVAAKNELLFQHGINFNDLPRWQKRGAGVFWEAYDKEGYNPKTNETVLTQQRRLKVESELPMKEEYEAFIGNLLQTT